VIDVLALGRKQNGSAMVLVAALPSSNLSSLELVEYRTKSTLPVGFK
jgi:hypothetical protein